MNWYIGQPIVAIKNHSGGRFKIGNEFIIRGLRSAPCGCTHVEIDIGLTQIKAKTRCTVCYNAVVNNTGSGWYKEHSFAPLDIDLSEIHEVLKQTEPV